VICLILDDMTKPGQDRAVATDPRMRGGRDHLVVCGDDALTLRMVEELTVRYGEEVTVIMPSARHTHRLMIARLPGVRIIERAGRRGPVMNSGLATGWSWWPPGPGSAGCSRAAAPGDRRQPKMPETGSPQRSLAELRSGQIFRLVLLSQL